MTTPAIPTLTDALEAFADAMDADHDRRTTLYGPQPASSTTHHSTGTIQRAVLSLVLTPGALYGPTWARIARDQGLAAAEAWGQALDDLVHEVSGLVYPRGQLSEALASDQVRALAAA